MPSSRCPTCPAPASPSALMKSTIVLVWEKGEPRVFDFEPVPHWDLGPTLDIVDFERGVKLSGTRFYLLKGPGRACSAR